MPETPVALQVPRICESCQGIGTVRLQHTIHGNTIMLHWHCAACEREWPVKRREEIVISPSASSGRGNPLNR
jgi:hypothetical protein